MQNTSFEFPAPWRWPRPWPPSSRRPRPAGARLRHGSGGHHRRRADSPLTFITNPKTPRQPLPASDGTDYLKTIPGFSAIRNGGTNGDPVLRGMFGSRLNILTNGSSMPGACPGRMDAPSSYISPETFDQLTVIKGPQTVLWGPGASAGTVRFDRDTPRFTEAGVRFDGSLTGGSFGRNDQTADFTAGNESVYVRVTGNHSHSQDYKDGNGLRVPSRWDKWNTDLALGFTPDADTLFELTAGTGDGEARYGGRGMDGSKFKRESFGLRFEAQPWRHVGKDRGPALLQLRRPRDGQLQAAPAGPQRPHADGDGGQRGPRHLGRPRHAQAGRHTDHDRRAGLPAEPTPPAAAAPTRTHTATSPGKRTPSSATSACSRS